MEQLAHQLLSLNEAKILNLQSRRTKLTDSLTAIEAACERDKLATTPSGTLTVLRGDGRHIRATAARVEFVRARPARISAIKDEIAALDVEMLALSSAKKGKSRG